VPRGTRVEAECAHGAKQGACAGVTSGTQRGTELENDNRTVGYFDEGDYLGFSAIDLSSVNVLKVLYATAGGGVVEVRLDSPTGKLIGTWEPLPTGGWTAWQPASIALTPTAGVHALYLVGASGSGICNLDWIQFDACTPDCSGKECGDNGCGQECGTCEGSDFCSDDRKCEPCVPDCAGKACGDDTCGGTCGSPCGTDEVCSAERECVPFASLGGPARLHVDGRELRDAGGDEAKLRGVSLIDLGQQFASRGGVLPMIDKLTGPGWKTNVLRFPVYTDMNPRPFPLDNAALREKYMAEILRPAVDYATTKGLYVIIDYHRISNVSEREVKNARRFWEYMAGQFAAYPNVIYELYNEPIDAVGACVAGNSDACWPPFKAKAESWIDVIRPRAPDTLLLVGGPSWSQVIGPAADDPVADANVAYVGHIYPFHMGNSAVENQIARCAAKHPVVLTEWGFGFEAGDDVPYETRIRDLVTTHDLHWTAWVADHSWGPPMFDKAGDLNAFGDFVKAWLNED
jgi:hypothetical protein